MNSAEKSRAAQRRDKKKQKQQHQEQQIRAPLKALASVLPAPTLAGGSATKTPKHKGPREPSNSDEHTGSSSSSSKSKKRRSEAAFSSPAAAKPPAAAAGPKVRVVEASAAALAAALEAAGAPGGCLESLLGDEALDSPARARALLAWLVAPLCVEDFLEQHFETAPLLVRRSAAAPHYYSASGVGSTSSSGGSGGGALLSKAAIARQVKVQRLVQGEEVTLTRFDPRTKVKEVLFKGPDRSLFF
jgi:hypothetical protein